MIPLKKHVYNILKYYYKILVSLFVYNHSYILKETESPHTGLNCSLITEFQGSIVQSREIQAIPKAFRIISKSIAFAPPCSIFPINVECLTLGGLYPHIY